MEKTVNILLVEDHEFTRMGLAMKIENEVKKKKNIYLRNANLFFAC